jgi:hypothetical protein
MKAALPLLAQAGLYDLQDHLRRLVEAQEARERNEMLLHVKCANPTQGGDQGDIARIRKVREVANLGIREGVLDLSTALRFVRGTIALHISVLAAHELTQAGIKLMQVE